MSIRTKRTYEIPDQQNRLTNNRIGYDLKKQVAYMLSEAGLKIIGNMLIGDTPGYYSYKTGPRIVEFFNSNFGFSDRYSSGFPSRWIYTLENIKLLWNGNRFHEFLNFILSKRFIMQDNNIREIDALNRMHEIVEYLNGELSVEGYKIIKKDQEYVLIAEDSDLEFIGEGGFANVFKSRSSGLIVKKLKDDFKTHSGISHRFKREFEITKSLSRLDGVIEVFDFNESDYSYTMEEAESTLENFIEEYEHHESAKLTMIRQILHIIKQIHNRNIIHRDISPNNILLFRGRLKISDFGLGKDLDMFHSHRTMRTHSLGQYYYCAPEQFMQLKEGDKQSDVYSLGSLINFIMTGDPRNSKHFLRNPVEKAKNENPNMRYTDAGHLLQGVESAISYYQNQERIELVKEKIESKNFDDDVNNFIYDLDANSLCKAILSLPGMVPAILSFIEGDGKREVETLQMIDDEYSNVCNQWEDYDKFGTIAYNIINSNLTYVAQEIAARILHDVAFVKSRFNMQRLVDDLIQRGIDPTIEEILER